LASWNFDTVYPGLNTTAKKVDLSKYDGVKYDNDTQGTIYQGGNPPVNLTFQAYHIMVALYALLVLWLIFAGIALRRANKGKVTKPLLVLLVFGPLIPFICIQTGWLVAEVGRQPWVVYNLLKTSDAVSPIVSSPELLITITLFVVFYLILFIAWLRLVLGQIKRGPDAALPASVAAADVAAVDTATAAAAAAAVKPVDDADLPLVEDISKGGE
jgi:cytochrome d ubiquinol oxidase subunit I